MKLFRVVLLALTIGFLPVGCSSIPAPQSTDQGIAYGITTVASVRATTTQLLQAKRIHSDEAQQVQNYANTARASIDTAHRYLNAGDQANATKNLELAQGVLKLAQDFLATKGGGIK